MKQTEIHVISEGTLSLMASQEISINTWQVVRNGSSVGISFSFRINKESLKLEYRDLTGPEKLKLFPAFSSTQSKHRNASDLGNIYGRLRTRFFNWKEITNNGLNRFSKCTKQKM